MNVWKGGTLKQHLTTEVDHAPGRTIDEAHAVVVDPGAVRLVEAFGGLGGLVNSSHHQALDCVGDGLRVAAYAAGDGVVEAVEGEEGFVVGVQWHPERTFARQAASRRLFTSFVEAAREWRASGTGDDCGEDGLDTSRNR
jgi:putative glutamine amidotransferase